MPERHIFLLSRLLSRPEPCALCHFVSPIYCLIGQYLRPASSLFLLIDLRPGILKRYSTVKDQI